MNIKTLGNELSELGSLDSPHLAETYAAPDYPQRDPELSACCAACIRGSRGLGYQPCGRKMACKCHDKPLPTFVAEVANKLHVIQARTLRDASEAMQERWGQWPSRIAKVGDL